MVETSDHVQFELVIQSILMTDTFRVCFMIFARLKALWYKTSHDVDT